MSERPPAPERVKSLYTDEVRRIASKSMEGLAETRLTPTALTTAGVLTCLAGAVLVYFEYLDEYLYFWLGAALFVLGSMMDILDGALARAGGKSTPFGAFIDSTTDRIGEAAMLGAIGLVFMRDGNEVALAFAFAAVVGSMLVSYTRAKAEIIGLKGDVGFGSRAERVAAIAAGLVLAPWGVLPWAIYALTATVWLTVGQRIWSVRSQLRDRRA
jgi:CDP-diacylglycerol--glycerol-3-phosphate 3-phosphatidyltransferase